MFVTGIVLAAGGSRRLGRPKPVLPLRRATLLDATMTLARGCRFDQLLVTLGGAADEVRQHVDLTGAEVVENAEFDSGCGSSLGAAVTRVDGRADRVVLLLSDQPDVQIDAVHRLLGHVGAAPIGICRYDDGPGHPFWLRGLLSAEGGSR